MTHNHIYERKKKVNIVLHEEESKSYDSRPCNNFSKHMNVGFVKSPIICFLNPVVMFYFVFKLGP